MKNFKIVTKNIMEKNKKLILRFSEISIKDVPFVGGKNASFGEMFSQLGKKGISIPDGFALAVNFYWRFIKEKLKMIKSWDKIDGISVHIAGEILLKYPQISKELKKFDSEDLGLKDEK